jgi:hypothetical protein
MISNSFLIILASILMTTVAMSDHGCCTEQEHDVVMLDGDRYFFATLPPLGFWEDSEILSFDSQRTSNWKGYVAAWEIKDDKLWLVSFNARRMGKEVDPEQLFEEKLPCIAKWVNGPLYFADDYYGQNPTGHYSRSMQRFFFLDGTVHKKEICKNEIRFDQGRIGLTLRSTNGAVVIEDITVGSPAEFCGELSVGNKLLTLIDTDNERFEISAMPVNKASQFLRGMDRQPIRLEFQGAKHNTSKIVEILRVRHIPTTAP